MEEQNKKRDLLDWLFTYVNKTLLVFKLYYLFYFAAFGSLFPLISVYFKQLGLSAVQCGILVGSRPFVEFVSGPIWGAIAERWKKGKLLIIISLFAGLSFTVGIGFAKPRPEGCLYANVNETRILKPSQTGENDKNVLIKSSKLLEPKLIGQSPIKLMDRNILHKLDSNTEYLVIPVYSPIVYHEENIYQTFVVLLILLIFGEFMSSPSLSLCDTALMNYLKDDRENFGRQRMYGSVGWGLAMFFVGIALDNAVKFYHHPCGEAGLREKNYMTCFAIFSVFMCFTLITATQVTFTYDDQSENMYFKVVKDKVSAKILGGTSKNRQQLVNEDEDIGNTHDDTVLARQLSIKLDNPQVKAKNDENYEDSHINQFDFNSWVEILKTFRSIRMGTLLFLAWFMGFGVGIVFTFLFWHLQDIRGTPTLFGIASVINHISEILAYFFSGSLITSIGHTKVLYLALLGNIARFLYVSWMMNPWWILPFEMLQGLTHAAVWSACFSYMSQFTPKDQRNGSQRVLQAIHHGLGKGCGSIFGGLIIHGYGSRILFRSYGIACCLVLIGFLMVNYFLPDEHGLIDQNDPHQSTNVLVDGDTTAPPAQEYCTGYDQPADTKNYVEDSMFMSPHGVPHVPNEYRRQGNYNSVKGNPEHTGFNQY